MYCVIQEIAKKTPNKYAHSKTIETYTYTFNGATKYCYNLSDERFARDIKKAYKVTIHESKRLNGVVTKKQYQVTTIDYYDFTCFGIDDFIIKNKLQNIADKLNTTYDALINLIFDKLIPIQDKIISEYENTEEYKTDQKNQKIINKYNKAKIKFNKKYELPNGDDTYNYCYNVFGELVNKKYLKVKIRFLPLMILLKKIQKKVVTMKIITVTTVKTIITVIQIMIIAIFLSYRKKNIAQMSKVI